MKKGRSVLVTLLAIGIASSILAWSKDAAPKPTVRFVYIGSSGCGFCRKPEYKKRIAEIRDAARAWAREHRCRFESVGVATSEDRQAGETFLADSGVGPYDKTVTGMGWAGADPYTKPYRTTNPLFAEGAPMQAEPQVVVLFEQREGDKPLEAIRSLGTMIVGTADVGYVARSLDRVSQRASTPP